MSRNPELPTLTNYHDEPEFAYTIDPNGTPDPNNYHLAADSFCKEKGSPDLSYTNQTDMDADGRVAGTYVDIGADEVDCEEVSHPLDWNADGMVNLHEFSRFSQAWLQHDPNDPVFDPNSASYAPNVSDPNHADYIDPNRLEGWDQWKFYNLDETGDSLYGIDLADLMVLCEDNPEPWLWQACWKDDGLFETMAMGEGMMMAPMTEAMSFESAIVEPVEEVDPYAEMSNPELAWFVKGIFEVIDSIEMSIDQDHENAENLLEAKEFLEDVLSDIETSRQ